MKKFVDISDIYLITTHRCNLACRYCFVHQDNIDMPLQIALDAIDFMIKNSPNSNRHQVFFFGGEPLLRYSDLIVPTVLYAKKKYPDKNIHFSMTTNSVLLDDEKLKFICDNNIGVLTSIDGAPETQDYNRPFHNGEGSSKIVEEHIKKYIDSGRSSTFRSTIIPETCNYLYDNYIYAQSLKYKSMFWITNAYSEWDEKHKQIVYDEMKKIADHYVDYYKKNNRPFLHISVIERHFKRIINDMEREKQGLDTINLFTDKKCGYGQNSCAAVAANGDLYGCQELVTNEGKKNTFWIGNIYTGVEDERRQALYDLFYSHPKSGDMPCEECCARSICNGGCSSTNYVLSGELNHCPTGHCFFNRHCYKIAYYIVNKLKDNEQFCKEFLSPKTTNCSCGSCQNSCQSLQSK